MRIVMACMVVMGLAASVGCSSSKKTSDSQAMAMHCSKCSADMKMDSTITCKCGNEVKVGDLHAKCTKCGGEVQMSDATSTCTKCGATMNQSTCKVKCPKCGGEADAKNMRCAHCSSAGVK